MWHFKLHSAFNWIVGECADKIDDDAMGVLENGFIEGGNMMLDIVLPLALEIRRNPAMLLDLPETNEGVFVTEE